MQHVGVHKHKVLLSSMFFQKYKNLFIKPQKDFFCDFWIGEGGFLLLTYYTICIYKIVQTV